MRGFSLLECLMVISILCVTYMLSLPLYKNWLIKQDAKITLHMLQQTLRYARSIAIYEKENIQICPSINAKFCGGTWGHGALIFNSNKAYNFITINSKGAILLKKFGCHKDLIEVSHSGMTHNNGHFEYHTKYNSGKIISKLFFNKSLLSYID